MFCSPSCRRAFINARKVLIAELDCLAELATNSDTTTELRAIESAISVRRWALKRYPDLSLAEQE